MIHWLLLWGAGTSGGGGPVADLGLITAALTWKARHETTLTATARHTATLTHRTDD